MAYIGRDTDKISNVEVLDNITFDGSSSYTLQKGGSNFTPSSANTLLVSIDGVVQAGNFTVSGSTIDFGTAVAGTSTCDFILHYGVGLITAPSDGTVTTAKLADSSVSLAKLTATGTKDATTFLRGDNTFDTPPLGGITMADSYRITADVFKTGTSEITANWEKVDTDSPGFIGSSMTESSGVFSFPSTGIYLILAYMYIVPDGVRTYSGHRIRVTTNNSTYNVATANHQHTTAGNYTISVSSNFILDVTDTSNVKVKLEYFSNGSATVAGSSTENLTVMTFIRLGDT